MDRRLLVTLVDDDGSGQHTFPDREAVTLPG